jgi:DNA-binding beta-propeller fold protein YncE
VRNVYFAEGALDTVRRLETGTNAISTYAGTGDQGFSGDNGPAMKARLANPSGLAVDAEGNLYISEFVNNRIRKVDAKTHTITTIAGNGLPHRVDVML